MFRIAASITSSADDRMLATLSAVASVMASMVLVSALDRYSSRSLSQPSRRALSDR